MLLISLSFYLLAILNILAFILFGIDKFQAIKNKRRIPEATLLGIALIGGALGSIAGMYFFHHKTLHKRFVFGLPLIFVLHICLLLFFV